MIQKYERGGSILQTFFYKHESWDQEAFEMVEQLFKALVAGELSQLKKFLDKKSFGYLGLSEMDAELYSEAVIRLENCNLSRMYVSTDQHRAVLNKIIESEPLKLKEYYTEIYYLKGIPGNVIMKAAVKLEDTKY